MTRLTLNRFARSLWPVRRCCGRAASSPACRTRSRARRGRRCQRRLCKRRKPRAGYEPAILAGGCFWGVQGVFEHVRGVKQAVSGYAGGSRETATYETVSSGQTDHAEVVRVSDFDPAVIRYDELLQIFFSVAHDPTQVNRQGPDTGPQYRSAIFPSDAEQVRVGEAYIAQLEAAKVYSQPIATRVERDATFYPAEDYHQDFMALHPRHLYIVANDAPKTARSAAVLPRARDLRAGPRRPTAELSLARPTRAYRKASHEPQEGLVRPDFETSLTG